MEDIFDLERVPGRAIDTHGHRSAGDADSATRAVHDGHRRRRVHSRGRALRRAGQEPSEGEEQAARRARSGEHDALPAHRPGLRHGRDDEEGWSEVVGAEQVRAPGRLGAGTTQADGTVGGRQRRRRSRRDQADRRARRPVRPVSPAPVRRRRREACRRPADAPRGRHHRRRRGCAVRPAARPPAPRRRRDATYRHRRLRARCPPGRGDSRRGPASAVPRDRAGSRRGRRAIARAGPRTPRVPIGPPWGARRRARRRRDPCAW